MSSNGTPYIPAALDDAGLTPHQFRVFCRVARRGECTESVARIAEATQMNEKTVRKALKHLRSRGMIQRTKRPGTTSIHEVTAPGEWHEPELSREDPQNRDSQKKGDHPSQKKGDHPSQFRGVPSKGTPLEGTPLEGAKERVALKRSPFSPPWVRRVVEQISWEAEPLPDDHPVRWDHLPGDWAFEFAAAAMTHLQELDLLASPTENKIDREGEDFVVSQWADTFRLLHEQDDYSRLEIKETMEWLFEGENFWIEKQAIRSVPPLRSKTKNGDAYKFDVMHQQAHSTSNGRNRNEDAKQRPEENWKRLARAAAGA